MSRALLFIMALLFVSRSQGQSSPELQALVEFFEQSTVTVNHPFYVYHWFNNSFVKLPDKLAATDPKGYEYFKTKTNFFWSSRGTFIDGSTLGGGLYAASDPWVTMPYGQDNHGSEQGWELLQIRINPGIKMINPSLEVKEFPKNIKAALKTFGCSARQDNVYEFFALPADNSRCYKMARHILNELLHIDIFPYSYNMSNLKGCDDDHLSAFVFMNPSRIHPEDVKLFNEFSRDSVEDRLNISYLKTHMGKASRTDYGIDGHKPLWSDLGKRQAPLDFKNWFESLYGCGSESFYK